MKQQDTDTEVFPLDAPTSSPVIAPGEIILGTIAGIDGQGQPLVDFPENTSGQPLAAISTVSITAAHVGRNAALLFA